MAAVSLVVITSFFLLTIINTIAVNGRPNFVFILTDDLDYVFNSTHVMDNLYKYIAKEGITFDNGFISTPICCPSRTETITGRSFQNIGPPHGSCMHIQTKPNVFNNTFSMFQIFHNNGYKTGSFGKLTNDMANFWCNTNQSNNIKQGFDRIHCPCQFNNFYGLQYYDLYMNNTEIFAKIEKTPSAHETPMTGNATINWIRNMINNYNTYPFIAWVGFHAPHFPATPTEWYGNEFNNLTVPRTPAFNLKTDDHHGFLSTNPTLNDTCIDFIDQIYRNRLRSLLPINDFIADLYQLLSTSNILNNTYIVFTSDHGYHLGQFRLGCCKKQPYDTDIRIPMMISGPNISKGIRSNNMVGNIDILPTFLDLADIAYDVDTYDGKSWSSFLFNSEENKNNNNNKDNIFRDIYLSQYIATATEGFNICQTWFVGNNGSTYPGQYKDPPQKNPQGEEWYVDNTKTNNWRALRILNETENLMYVEFVNADWNNDSFDNPNFVEFYDLNIDPYQLNNTYKNLNESFKNELHQLLMQYGQCKGS